MTKQLILTLNLLVGVTAMSQVVLTYETHALLPDKVNTMQLTTFADWGPGGANQVWDFSRLDNTAGFRGTVDPASGLKSAGLDLDANIVLREFQNNFYFQLTADRLEQWGYSSTDGTSRETYTQPFVKMTYPFAFGDSHSGTFAGSFAYGAMEGSFTGNYEVEADGYGKLLLPGGVELNNTLRVRSLKNYTRTYPGGHTDRVEATTIRWYSADIRFPLLVLTKIEVITDGNTSITHQAAYRTDFAPEAVATNSLVAVSDLQVFPNPFGQEINLAYTLQTSGNVTIALYDQSGRLAEVLESRECTPGDFTRQFYPKFELSQGLYYLYIIMDGKATVTRLEHLK